MLLDIKGQYLSLDVLRILVLEVNVPDIGYTETEEEGIIPTSLLKRTRELVGRVTSIYPVDGGIWEIYAALAPMVIFLINGY